MVKQQIKALVMTVLLMGVGCLKQEIFVQAENAAPAITQLEVMSNGGTLFEEEGVFYTENLEDTEDIRILAGIYDEEFDASQAIMEYSMDGELWEVLELKEGDAWSTDTAEHFAVYYFDGEEAAERNYQFRMTYCDTESAESPKVVIDHKKPEITDLTYQKPVKEDDETLYYDKTAEVQFSVADKYLKTENVEVKVYQRAHKEAEWEPHEETFTFTQPFSLQIPENEGEYCFTVACKDLAGNEMNYQSPAIVIDKTAPSFEVFYEKEPEIYNCVESVKTLLVVTERNLDMEHTIINAVARDINGNVLESLETTWMELLEVQATSPNYEKFPEMQTLMLEFSKEGNYEVQVEMKDCAGKSVVYEKTYCIDRTAPEVEILFEEADFVRAADKCSYHFFGQKDLVLKVKVQDPISGIHSLTPTCVDEKGEELSYGLSAPLANDEDKSTVYYELAFETDFKGMLKMYSTDHAGNVSEDTKEQGLILESIEMHEQQAFNEIRILTPYSKTKNFYAGDVKVNFTSKDHYAGLYKVGYQAGDYEEIIVYPEAEEICYEAEKEYVISSKDHNSNHIPMGLGFEDYAGHFSVVSEKELPIIHIDTTAPQIEVEYNNQEAKNGKYYKESRTAVVTITERNFDPKDTNLEVTGEPVTISDWSHRAGSGCAGSNNPEDTHHTDQCQWTATVEFSNDGEYTFTCSTTDLAGNENDYGKTDTFVIDKTHPQIKVTYDNYESENSFYYNRARAATIEITEQNFQSSDVRIQMSAVSEGRELPAPKVSSWSSSGNVHWATIVFDYDGIFEFNIFYEDLAGNASEDYISEQFVVDLTAPEIHFSDIAHLSANNGVVAPGIWWSDVNYDAESTNVMVSGYCNGPTEWNGTRTNLEQGIHYQLEDMAYEPEMDDLYTLYVTVKDLAGNVGEETILFSVNRFGSIYAFNKETEALVGPGGTYYTKKEQEIVVLETNVDTLKFREITLNFNGNLKTLVEDVDFKVLESGSEESWKQYTYRIDPKNFSEEGTYFITIYSEDRANNISDNYSKGKCVEFVVDKTSPSILLTGIEDQALYREEQMEVLLDVEDNVHLQNVKVILNGEILEFDEADIAECDGRVVLSVESSNQWQTMEIAAVDMAGNESRTEKISFLVTPNILVQFYQNQPLFWCSMTLFAGTGVLIGMFVYKRKKSQTAS